MKTTHAIAKCLAALVLSGCAGHTHQLVSSDAAEPATGWLDHLGGEERVMVLDLGGQRFEGRGFDVQRSLSKRRPRYGSGPPHRKAADSYVYTAEPILHSEDGSTLRCSIAWRASEPPAGSCTTAEGRRIAVRFG